MTDHMCDGPLAEMVTDMLLVDHHVHGALRTAVDRPTFESMITEAPEASSAGSQFDSQVGFAIRRWCSPLLDLDPHTPADQYWTRRCELGEVEINRRLLGATGTAMYLLETGYLGDAVLDPAEHAAASGAQTREVIRLETLAETLLSDSGSAQTIWADFPQALARATAHAVGTKSIVAYRHGFDLSPDRPGAAEVLQAADRLLSAIDGGVSPRISDPVLLRHLLWCAIDLGLPLQIHCGYGDPDLDLSRANPLLLTNWLRQVAPSKVPVVLLHNYPYHREAGYLAQVFDNVYFDVGLGVNYTGAQSRQLLAESLEVAPFHKQLFSSDAWGPSELHLLGAILWRRGVSRIIGQWVTDHDWSAQDAERVLHLIGHQNAERLYQL